MSDLFFSGHMKCDICGKEGIEFKLVHEWAHEGIDTDLDICYDCGQKLIAKAEEMKQALLA